MKCGIIGPPNVGKSSLFNSLVKKQLAEVANYAFCTINPNTASVPYNDKRLSIINNISKAKKIIPSTLHFVDIAGIVPNAADNVGLGNAFLSTMSSVDLIIQVVRCFDDDLIGGAGKIEGKTEPIEDITYILIELVDWDNKVWKKYCEKDKKNTILNNKLFEWLNAGKTVRDFLKNLDEKEKDYFTTAIKSLAIITDKPMIIACNISSYSKDKKNIDLVLEKCEELKIPVTVICGNFFHATNEMEEEDKNSILSLIEMKDDGVDNLVELAFNTLGLIQFFTTGEEETRAWTIQKNSTAPEAAGAIHTDFTTNFITAEVVHWETFIKEQGWTNCKNKGLIKNEGKTYIVKDGDIIVFKCGKRK